LARAEKVGSEQFQVIQASAALACAARPAGGNLNVRK